MSDERDPSSGRAEDEPLRLVYGARTEFAGNVSRDLRAPLTLLLGPLQDLLDGPAAALAPGMRAVLERARRDAVRLLQLVDLLPAALTRRGTAASPGTTDLGSFTAELAGYFRPLCEAAGLQLEVDCPSLSPQADVDREAWERIVVNLVANAFKSTLEGTIAVRLRLEEGTAELTVSDTSPGMPPAELRYVFERLDRAAPASAESSAGGFGLPFVRSVVRQQMGTIDVRSTVGGGTTFVVGVPLRGDAADVSPVARFRARAEPAPSPPRRAVPAGQSRGHVVIAEDHPETRDYLYTVLQTAGFTVDAVADGNAALAACVMRAPDVLVSDVLMPGLGGFELIERLRADERTAVIPVLLLSARGGEESRIEGIAAGADDYLVKPLSGRELVARVDGAVRLGRLRRDTARREQADLDALFSLAPDAALVVGQNGAIVLANEQAGKLFGHEARDLLGLQVEALMPQTHRAAHVAHRDAYKRAPVVRLMHPRQELRGLRADGSEFTAEIALGPLVFKNQPCTIAIVRDVSERRKLEHERTEQERRFRELSSRLVEVQEAERRQLSTELHDRTSPQLAAIQINLRMLANLLRDRETEDIGALLDDTVHLLADTTATIRDVSSDLRPAVLDDGGLLPALDAYTQQFTQRTGIQVQLDTREATRPLPPAVQSSLFRIVQEALTNCVKHARARNIAIRLSSAQAPLIALTIADDGVGFDAEALSTTGLGLLTMRERAEFLGGRFTIDSRRGEGTRIEVQV